MDDFFMDFGFGVRIYGRYCVEFYVPIFAFYLDFIYSILCLNSFVCLKFILVVYGYLKFRDQTSLNPVYKLQLVVI